MQVHTQSLCLFCDTAIVKPVVQSENGHSTSWWTETKFGHSTKCVRFHLALIKHCISQSKNRFERQQPLTDCAIACEGHIHKQTTSQMGYVSLLLPCWSGWHWFGSASLLPPLCFYFISPGLCLLSWLPFIFRLKIAFHRGFRVVSGGKFGFQQLKLDFARAAQNVLANNHPSVSGCGLLGRTFRLWILNRNDWWWKKNDLKWVLCPTLKAGVWQSLDMIVCWEVSGKLFKNL